MSQDTDMMDAPYTPIDVLKIEVGRAVEGFFKSEPTGADIDNAVLQRTQAVEELASYEADNIDDSEVKQWD